MIGVGDLVVCISAPIGDSETLDLWKPTVGETCTVIEVKEFADGKGIGLNFAEDPDYQDDAAFDAIHFRKIQHDKREACESEFVKLLNRTRKEVSA